MLRWLTAGESHGPSLVAILEGLPAHVRVTTDDLADSLARRRLGYGRGARMKFEQDQIRVLGGVRHGETQGGPVAIEVAQRELVELGARDLPLVGDQLGADALAAHVVVVLELVRERAAVALGDLLADRERDVAHVLDAGADHDVVDAGADQRGAEVDGGLGGSALAVERRRRGLDREALLQPRVAGDVLRLLAHLLGAAGDHLLDLGGVDAGALDQLGVRAPEQVRRVRSL